MNGVSDVIIMNECNQTDEYNAVLRTKMCVHVRVLAILLLAAAAVLVAGGVSTSFDELIILNAETGTIKL
ncbi:MAG: hypothetical protein U9N46_05295 [Euryarchaeota archaeon]|nr:hypothetical protein [Euryarchaeota archaeon]